MSGLQIATTLLSANAGVIALVSAAKVFPIDAPQNTEAPYLLVNHVSGRDEQMIETSGKYYRTRISVQAVSRSAMEVMDIGDAVIAALDNVIKQTVGDFNDVDVLHADVDITDPNDTRSAYLRTLHFFIRWRR